MVTFHPIHHPVMDMGSRSLTAEGVVEGTDGVKHRGAGCGGVDGYVVSKCVFGLFLCIFS